MSPATANANKTPPKNIQSNPRLHRYEQFNPAKLPTRGRPLIVRSQPPYDDRCQSPMPSPREVKEMSCPGLVAKSGIAWTLRAGQDGQAGGGCYQDTRVRPGEREMPSNAQRVEKLLGHGTKRLPRRGGGGNLAAWQVRGELSCLVCWAHSGLFLWPFHSDLFTLGGFWRRGSSLTAQTISGRWGHSQASISAVGCCPSPLIFTGGLDKDSQRRREVVFLFGALAPFIVDVRSYRTLGSPVATWFFWLGRRV